MNAHKNTTTAPTAAPQAQAPGRGALLRVLLPAFLVLYAALPIAVARHSR